jgi:hypothetical protein
MNAATRFKIANATPVDCGGGRVAYIRPLTPMQMLKGIGRIPASFAETVESKMDPNLAKKAEIIARDNPDFAVRWLKCVLAESVIAVRAPDPETGKPVTDLVHLVDKPQAECAPGEISLSVFEDDSDFVNAVLDGARKLNGWTEEAAESAKPFLRGPGFAWLLKLSLASLWARSDAGDEVAAH